MSQLWLLSEPLPMDIWVNGEEALGEGTLHLCTEFTEAFLYLSHTQCDM